MILDRLFRAQKVDPKHPKDPGLIKLFNFGQESATGLNINEDTAYQIPAAMAAIKVLSEDIASLPLVLYENVDDGKKEAKSNHVYELIRTRPNRYQTSYQWRLLCQMQLLTRGNSYNQIIYDGSGSVKEFIPLNPDNVHPFIAPNGDKAYRVGQDVYLDGEIMHIMGPSKDGLVGMSPIMEAQEAFALSLAAERFGGALFGNGARPGGVMSFPEKLSDEAYKRLVNSWERRHQGVENAHKVAILEEGGEFKTVSIPPEQAQFLETRKFQRSEIAAIFRVPPHMIGDLERATFSNIEHQGIEYVTHTLRPWVVNWEQALEKALFTERNRSKFEVEFKVDGLLRGDIKSRYDAYSTGRNWGFLSVNDIRRLENMNPVENGDIYLQPLNMVEAGEPPEQRVLPIVDKVSERVITKEVKALRGGIEKGKPASFLDEFYNSHAEYLSASTGMTLEASQQWCDEQKRDFKENPNCLDDWSSTGVDRLSNFMKENL